jgi:hypothetical protein
MEFSQFSGSRGDSVGSNGDYDRTTAHPETTDCGRMRTSYRPTPSPTAEIAQKSGKRLELGCLSSRYNEKIDKPQSLEETLS